MYLKEIKIYGFKSFADKINIEFGKNINGIVGPNGTGKSNIVDAVRWVLGEQSIKSLRGETSADVIFSGSASRKQQNSASVNLIFDNSDHKLPLDYEEVSIRRVAFRTGENEYYINNTKCRLKDITELLTTSGTAKESFNIIGQGKIDEIILTKPSERRVIFEEAAGVLKYKRRKEEAIRKLERTNLNVNRINDIISELNVSLEPLKVQSLKAKEFLKVKEELKNIEISLITNDIERVNDQYSNLKTEVEQLFDEISMLSATSSNDDVILLKEKQKQKNLEEDITSKQEMLLNLTKQIEGIDADIRVLKERQKYQDKLSDIESNILSLKEKILNIEDNIKLISNEQDINNKKVLDIDTKIKLNNDKYNALKDNKDKIAIELDKIIKKKINLTYKIDLINTNDAYYPNAVKSILNNKKFTFVHNVIGALLTTNDIYSQAISTSLGASANYIVIDKSSEAKELIKYLKDNNIGRATFFPLDVIKARQIDVNTLEILKNTSGFVNTADKLVTYEEKYKNIILNQLGNVIVATNIDSANEISKRINNRYKIVTLDGNQVNVGGSITGGKSNNSNIISLKYELDKLKQEVDKLDSDSKTLEHNNKQIIQNITIVQEEIYKLNLRKNEIIQQNNNSEKIKNNYKYEKENLTKELSDLNNITNKVSEVEILLDKYYRKKQELDTLEKELNILKIDNNRVKENIVELEQVTNTNKNIISKKEKKLSELNVLIGKMDVKLDNLLVSLSNDYNITFEYAKENYHLEKEVDEARKLVNNYKNRITELGTINLGSIDEYDRINDRYEFLTKQKNDLINAKESLNEIIKEMDKVMETKFLESFKEIQIEFKKVFRTLFKGGNASLILTDPNNLLETGIEIKVEPPGKKFQSISLLSGGEKTFTAISLLFAILNVRSVPFCLFDEVEAALDDANVENFGNYLNTYKDKTQFILITHKKKTMEFADVLYGITMQESGVSKLVSVRLEDLKK